MAPKVDQPAGSPSKASNESFLAVCVRAGKAKLAPDFEKVAALTGLSTGGSRYANQRVNKPFRADLWFRNKFNALMKQLEGEGATWAQDGADSTKTPTKKPVAKRARATPKKEVKSEAVVNGDDDENEEAEPPKKKAATTKAKAAKAAKEKREAAEESDDGGGGTTSAPDGDTKAKATKTKANTKVEAAASKKGKAKKAATAEDDDAEEVANGEDESANGNMEEATSGEGENGSGEAVKAEDEE